MVDKIIEYQIAVMNASRPSSKKREEAANIIYSRLSSHRKAVLKELVYDGPVKTESLISKVACDDLIKWGLAVRVSVKGIKGYVAATDNGWEVLEVAPKQPCLR